MLHSNDDFKEEDFARVCRNLILDSAIFSWVSKVTCNCFVLALLRFVIGSKKSPPLLLAIRCVTRTNHDLVACVFPRFT